MVSPNDQKKFLETEYIVIKMGKLLGGDFKTVVLRKLNKIQENREMILFSCLREENKLSVAAHVHNPSNLRD